MQEIKIDQLIRSQRRTIALEITVEGKIIVRAPKRWSMNEIHEFVNEKSSWVKKKLFHIKSRPPIPERFYLPGEKFLYLGNTYTLHAIENNPYPFYFDDSFKIATEHLLQAKKLLFNWYQRKGHVLFNERAGYYAQLHGYRYQRVSLSNAKRRWGSCNSQGYLRFNWRLIMAPLFVIDYVVAHELAHLKQMDHSPRFWHHVSQMMPNYLQAKQWLKDNGHQLML